MRLGHLGEDCGFPEQFWCGMGWGAMRCSSSLIRDCPLPAGPLTCAAVPKGPGPCARREAPQLMGTGLLQAALGQSFLPGPLASPTVHTWSPYQAHLRGMATAMIPAASLGLLSPKSALAEMPLVCVSVCVCPQTNAIVGLSSLVLDCLLGPDSWGLCWPQIGFLLDKQGQDCSRKQGQVWLNGTLMRGRAGCPCLGRRAAATWEGAGGN